MFVLFVEFYSIVFSLFFGRVEVLVYIEVFVFFLFVLSRFNFKERVMEGFFEDGGEFLDF